MVIGYLNGQQKFNESRTLWPSSLPSVSIGSGFDTNRYWKGQLDDVRIYNYALTPSQIKQVMNQGAGVRFGP